MVAFFYSGITIEEAEVQGHGPIQISPVKPIWSHNFLVVFFIFIDHVYLLFVFHLVFV